MRSTKTRHVVSAHAEGEVGDVIVGGVALPSGAGLCAMREALRRDQTRCTSVLNDPQGGVVRLVSLLVPPKDPRTQAMAGLRVQIATATDGQPGVRHPENPDWRHLSVFRPRRRTADHGCRRVGSTHAVRIGRGQIDRLPAGRVVPARLAIAAARGPISPGAILRARSLIGGQVEAGIVERAKVGDKTAILPRISGCAWITGTHRHMLDPDDHWPEGYRLSDTWGAR
jgi:proline racemase